MSTHQLTRFREAMQAAELPAFVVSDLASVAWLTGFSGSFGTAVVTPDAQVFLSDSRYTLQAAEEVQGWEVATFSNPVRFEEFLSEHLQRLEIDRLAYDQNTMTIAKLNQLQGPTGSVEWIAADDPVVELRMIKSDEEIRRIREACRLADDAMRVLVDQVRPGISELELLIHLETFLRRNGSRTSFAPIIVSGHRSARPHGDPSDKLLEEGDFVTFDLGAVVDGYCSDITRTVVVGSATDRHRFIYDQVLQAEQAGVSLLHPGANGREIDAHVRSLLAAADLAQYFGHGLGHGLGALVHDSGRLSPTMDQEIAVNQVWTIEPGVYVDGFGGVRIEDDVLVTAAGPESLTEFPREMLELPV